MRDARVLRRVRRHAMRLRFHIGSNGLALIHGRRPSALEAARRIDELVIAARRVRRHGHQLATARFPFPSGPDPRVVTESAHRHAWVFLLARRAAVGRRLNHRNLIFLCTIIEYTITHNDR